MIVLGFDTATISTAVALRLADGETLQARDDPPPGGHPGHATRLLAMADELLREAGLRWDALERIAVGLGPGRFTGLRVGIATARGLAQSLGVGLVGVSSLRALAQPALREEAQMRGVLAVIDARRGEAFLAAYAFSGTLARERPDGERLAEGETAFPRALSPSELQCAVALAEQRGAAPGQSWLALGDGSLRYREQLELAGAHVPDDLCPLHLLDPRAICELGERAPEPESHALVLPDYRRAPDAALAQQAAGAAIGSGP